MAKETLGDVIMAKLEELEMEYRDLLDQRAANRRTCRDLATQGILTDEQVARVDAVYPLRSRGEAEQVEA